MQNTISSAGISINLIFPDNSMDLFI